MFLIFDVETTGFIKEGTTDYSHLDNYPRIVQLAFQLHDINGKLIKQYTQIVKPDGFEIPYAAAQIHKITTERAKKEGIELVAVLKDFLSALEQAEVVAGHNILSYDIRIITAEFIRAGIDTDIFNRKIFIDTCSSKEVINFCQLSGGKGGGFKSPKLSELYEKLFGKSFELAHNAAFDVHANAAAFFELLKRQIIQIPSLAIHPNQIEYELPNLETLYHSEKQFHTKKSSSSSTSTTLSSSHLSKIHFAYLHNHSIYSISHSTVPISKLVKKAAEYGASALALTDLSYMSGVVEFYNAVKEINKEIKQKNAAASNTHNESISEIKPIIGCEFYLCEDLKKENSKSSNYQIPILAKNLKGYSNLCKLSSLSFIDGFYYVPRIDKKNLLANKEGLIVLSGWIYGEIPQVLLNEGEQRAEELVLWYKEHFQDDFYLELNNHFLEEEKYINEFLIKMAEKHQIKAIAAQNNYYLNPDEAEAFDTLICIKNGETKSKPIGKGSGKRYGLPNNEFYFKSPTQIQELFSFYPQAITNAIELAQKIEVYSVEKEVVLPKFDIPKEFAAQHSNLSEKELENEYLKYLTYKGAEKKYPQMTDEIKSRIDFELSVIAKMGFPGYFLIVSDILAEARKRGIRIGPGRGSAAGSIVAYCVGITNVDPIQYNLLFERFLNPERVSMPDIDIDIADDRREEVIEYIVQKYGKERVANIITFASLGGKSAIKDTARALGLNPQEINLIAQAATPLIDLKISIEEILHPEKIKLGGEINDEQSLHSLQSQIKTLYDKYIQSHPRAKEVLEQASKIEGCLRHTGKHACGLIIAPEKLDTISPLGKDTKSGQIIAQFDISVAEKAGLLKMDFLGLTTLSIITETLKYVKQNKGIEIDIDNIPLNDEQTFDIFKNGYTDEIFQFESPGMKKYLKQLKPDNINDLIAMNALYRPGPMKYIDSYIRRKHKIEKIEYPFPEMKDILEETYGITVYQEQVMLLSQRLAGFTKGQADELRKAMGKKKLDVLQKMEQQFLEGCKKNGYPIEKVKKIWEDWKDFASYAFNKSHSVCYAILAYQTAYLKAHFPSEFMCAALNTKQDIESIANVLYECYRMGIKILPPDINESTEKFNVTPDENIRFGLSYIKNVSSTFVTELIHSRKEKGKIQHIFELSEKLPPQALNKRSIESLAQAGAFDSLPNIHRAMFFVPASDGYTLTEKLSRWAETQQKNQGSIFDTIQYPDILPVKEWDTQTHLTKEKEVLGLFISATPLDKYQILIQYLPNYSTIKALNDAISEGKESIQNKNITIAGWINSIEQRLSRNNTIYYNLVLEDVTGKTNTLFISDEIARACGITHHINDLKCYVISGTIENKNRLGAGIGNEWEYRVHQCVAIDDVIKQKSRLKILVYIKDIQLSLINDFEKMFNTNGGISIPVSLVITDEEKRNYVSTTNDLKINFDKTNFELLSKYNLQYKIVVDM